MNLSLYVPTKKAVQLLFCLPLQSDTDGGLKKLSRSGNCFIVIAAKTLISVGNTTKRSVTIVPGSQSQSQSWRLLTICLTVNCDDGIRSFFLHVLLSRLRSARSSTVYSSAKYISLLSSLGHTGRTCIRFSMTNCVTSLGIINNAIALKHAEDVGFAFRANTQTLRQVCRTSYMRRMLGTTRGDWGQSTGVVGLEDSGHAMIEY